MAVSYVAMVVAVLSAVAIPRLLGVAIDEALASGLRRQLLLMAGMAGSILLLGVLRGVTGYAQTYLSQDVSQRGAYDLLNDFFRKLQGLSFGFHDRQQTGDLMSKGTADIEAVRWFFGMGLTHSIRVAVMLIAVGAILLSMNWRLGLVSLAFVPLVLWHALVMARTLRYTWMQVQRETGKMTTVLQENLAGMRVVKAFGAREHEEAKFEERASAVAHHTYLASLLFASRGSRMTFIFTVATGAILWVGGREVLADRLTAGEIAAFLLYMGLLAMPVRMTGWVVNIYSRAISAGQRIFDVIDAESPVKDAPGALPLSRASGHVRFEGVSISYDSGTLTPAVRNIDFEAQPGQLVATLGAPGSGKSTLVHLIPRFYDVSEGRVTVDGVDVRDATLASVRANVGIVLQDVFVFAAPLKDNIEYGSDGVTMEQVVRASEHSGRLSDAHPFDETSLANTEVNTHLVHPIHLQSGSVVPD